MSPILFALAQLLPVLIGAVAQVFTGRRREWVWLVAQAGFVAFNFSQGLHIFGAASVVYALLCVRNLVLLYQPRAPTTSPTP